LFNKFKHFLTPNDKGQQWLLAICWSALLGPHLLLLKLNNQV
jgi:hypothetical protein